MCKHCRVTSDMKPHCGGMVCGWTVCNVCGATSDFTSKDSLAYFEKKSGSWKPKTA